MPKLQNGISVFAATRPYHFHLHLQIEIYSTLTTTIFLFVSKMKWSFSSELAVRCILSLGRGFHWSWGLMLKPMRWIRQNTLALFAPRNMIFFPANAKSQLKFSRIKFGCAIFAVEQSIIWHSFVLYTAVGARWLWFLTASSQLWTKETSWQWHIVLIKTNTLAQAAGVKTPLERTVDPGTHDFQYN